MRSAPLFDADLPDGFHYRPDFVSAGEEASLAEMIGRVEFATFEMRGVAARRRVAFFGASYDAASVITREIPSFLLPLRERLASWAGVEREAFAMALINEYPSGAPIGWHRDAPQYGIVAGVSLLSACRMRLRPYVAPQRQGAGRRSRRTATHEIVPVAHLRRVVGLDQGEQRPGRLLVTDAVLDPRRPLPPATAV